METKAKPGGKGELTDAVGVALALAGPGLLAIVVYAFLDAVFGVAILIATCAFAVGASLGFLFGIPQYLARQNQETGDKPSYQPNTNLTQVSDWLTKILIGVGLVEFGQLTESLGNLGEDLAPTLMSESATVGAIDPAGRAFAIALVVGFFVIGFLVGYLYTRLRLQSAFTQADRGAFEESALAEIQRAERVRPPGEDDGVAESTHRPVSADYAAVVKELKARLRFLWKILGLKSDGPRKREYAAIASVLRRKALITSDEEQFILELVSSDLDPDSWPPNARDEFLDSAWVFAVRLGAMVWDKNVRNALHAAGWFVADYEQALGHRPDFLAYCSGKWALMSARVGGDEKGPPASLEATARRIAGQGPAEQPTAPMALGAAVEGRCLVIPDIRRATVAGDSSRLLGAVAVIKLGTLLKHPEAAFDGTNEDARLEEAEAAN